MLKRTVRLFIWVWGGCHSVFNLLSALRFKLSKTLPIIPPPPPTLLNGQLFKALNQFHHIVLMSWTIRLKSKGFYKPLNITAASTKVKMSWWYEPYQGRNWRENLYAKMFNLDQSVQWSFVLFFCKYKAESWCPPSGLTNWSFLVSYILWRVNYNHIKASDGGRLQGNTPAGNKIHFYYHYTIYS